MKQTDRHTDRRETIMTNSLTHDDMQAADAATPGSTLNRALLTLGAAGPVLFLIVSTLLGMLDSDFDVMTEPVSALAWGPLRSPASSACFGGEMTTDTS